MNEPDDSTPKRFVDIVLLILTGCIAVALTWGFIQLIGGEAFHYFIVIMGIISLWSLIRRRMKKD